jgi:hypothetical protein
MRLVPQVTETLTEYDDTKRSLTYQASGGMPAFVTLARNTWAVTALDALRSRVSLRARFETRGLLGLLGRWAILAHTQSHQPSRRRRPSPLRRDWSPVALQATPAPPSSRPADQAGPDAIIPMSSHGFVDQTGQSVRCGGPAWRPDRKDH